MKRKHSTPPFHSLSRPRHTGDFLATPRGVRRPARMRLPQVFSVVCWHGWRSALRRLVLRPAARPRAVLLLAAPGRLRGRDRVCTASQLRFLEGTPGSSGAAHVHRPRTLRPPRARLPGSFPRRCSIELRRATELTGTGERRVEGTTKKLRKRANRKRRATAGVSLHCTRSADREPTGDKAVPPTETRSRDSTTPSRPKERAGTTEH